MTNDETKENVCDGEEDEFDFDDDNEDIQLDKLLDND